MTHAYLFLLTFVSISFLFSLGNSLSAADIPQPPDPPVLVSPPNGATGVPLNPTLRWNAASRARTYHLQVARDSAFTAIVVEQTELYPTEYQLTNLAYNTRYYWRVRAINQGGESPFSSTWSFTTLELIEPPSAPTLLAPTNGAQGVSRSPTLQWNPVQNATAYHLQVAADENMATILFEQNDLRQPSQQLTGLAFNTRYYWRVRALNAAGPGPWSELWSFTTEQDAPNAVEENAPPGTATVYPNPVVGTATVCYTLYVPSHVLLTIYDARGQVVETVIRGAFAAGAYQQRWDPPYRGTFFYQLEVTPLGTVAPYRTSGAIVAVQ